MDVLKRHAEKIVLLALALILVVASVLILMNLRGFNDSFRSLTEGPPPDATPEPVDVSDLDLAERLAREPAQWISTHPLFVARPHILVDGRLVNVEDDDTIKIHPPVPNQWLRENDLDLLDMGILARDTDGDGFSNIDEWEAATDPRDPGSRPPYFTKLRLESFEQENFRILFAERTGDTFQIETIDQRGPTQFLQLGETIRGTNYELARFEEKFVDNPATGGRTDVSELTIVDTESGREITLVIEQVANDPDSFATIRDLWANQSINVQKGEEFALEQEPDVKYVLTEISDQEAKLKITETGTVITIPPLEESGDSDAADTENNGEME